MSGADVCLLALDRHMVRDPGLRKQQAEPVRTGRNIVQLVVECDGPLPQGRIEDALGRFNEYAPWASARANDSSCRWPAEKLVPRSRTGVS